MKQEIIQGDCLEVMKSIESGSVDCCITSPPYYGLRDYGVEGQLGLEDSPEEYVNRMVEVFREVKRVLKDSGTLWLNLGDSYATNSAGGWQGKNGQRAGRSYTAENIKPKKGEGLKAKDLIGIPWMVAFALRNDGWYLRQDIIWAKPNVMPESVKDRCTRSHEHVFMLSKFPTYYYDQDAIREPLAKSSVERVKYGWKSDKANQAGILSRTAMKGIDVDKMGERFANPKGRNKRDVWYISTSGSDIKHIAMFPKKLIEPMVLSGCPIGGTVLDPFLGSGTTLLVARDLGRKGMGIELSPEYCEIARKRLEQDTLL